MEYLNIVVIALLIGLFLYVVLMQRRGQKGQDILFLQEQISDLQKQTKEDKSDLSTLILRTNETLNIAANTLTQVQSQLQHQMTSLREQTSNEIHKLTEQLNLRLSDTHGTLNTRLEQHSSIVKEVHGKLEGLFEATKRVQEMKQDVKDLLESFKAPKSTGKVGEMLLEKLLKDALPPALWELQYPFKDGSKVDAVIKMEGKLVPVDAKFPMDNFMRFINAKDDAEKKVVKRDFTKSVKFKIDEIAKKYIHPDEGTYDYAFMYVPAEGVYNEITIRDDFTEEDLLDYARKKKVFPMSPNTFWAYLQTIHFGLNALKIEEKAEEVINKLRALKIDFGKFREDFEKLGNNLRLAKDRHEDARKDLDRFGDRLEKIESLGAESETSTTGTPPDKGRVDTTPQIKEL